MTVLDPEQRGVGDRNMSEAPVPPVSHLTPEVCTPAVPHVIKIITRVTAVVDSGCSTFRTVNGRHGGVRRWRVACEEYGTRVGRRSPPYRSSSARAASTPTSTGT
jgi:hypothetical protein